MVAFLWAVSAGATAVGLEFAFRHSDLSWVRNLWWLAPAALWINFSIYQLMRSDAGWLYGMVLFGCVTATARIVLSLVILHEPLTAGNVAAAAVLVLGALVKLVWR